MEQIGLLPKFKEDISQDAVFSILHVSPDSEVYEQVLADFEVLKPLAAVLVEPLACFRLGSYRGNESCVYCLVTVGDKISRYSTEYFHEGDYMKGMLLNVMADVFLSQLEAEMMKHLKIECAKKRVGVAERLEAGGLIGMELQKQILDKLECGDTKRITVTEGFMYNPVKTTGFILLLSDDPAVFRGQHACETCDLTECHWRHRAGNGQLS